jgi:hypothetical protein
LLLITPVLLSMARRSDWLMLSVSAAQATKLQTACGHPDASGFCGIPAVSRTCA